MKVPNQRVMNALLAAAALAVGGLTMGWRGVLLALTVIGFWMVLQFNRATRQVVNVANRPMGMVDSVITLQSQLAHGMSMSDVLAISGSLGQRVQGTNGDWMWRDSYGNEIVVTFRRDGVHRWHASRTDGSPMTDRSHPAGGTPAAA
ncbi:MAG: hypothetical protein RLZZ592_441 [Pseudomonadota bacterium]|jgi:hypothetical protein|nr:hypothetical protein [Pseudomonadota bacterium]